MEWWDGFWKWAGEKPLGATVVGGLILAVLLKLFPPVWIALKRAWVLLVSLRITTTGRIAAREARAREAGYEAGKKDAERAPDPAPRSAPSSADGTDPPAGNVLNYANLHSVAAGLKIISDASHRALQPSATKPKPLAVWHLDWTPALAPLLGRNARQYRLTNQAGGVTAARVRVTADDARIRFPKNAYRDEVGPHEPMKFIGIPELPMVENEPPIIYAIQWMEGGHLYKTQVRAAYSLV